MNYIKRLEMEVVELGNDIEIIDNIVTEAYKYLNSEKFRCGDELDGYVNVKDIMRYLDRIRGNV
jgi:hypothetical protein